MLTLTLIFPAFAQDTRQQAAELEQLRGRIQALQQSLSSDRSQKDRLSAQLGEIETRIGAINTQLHETRQQLKHQSEKLRQLQREEQALQADLTRQRQALGDEARAAYIMSRQGFVKLLLNQREPAGMGRNLVYYDYLQRAHLDRIEEADAKLLKIGAVQQAITEQSERLERLKRDQQTQKQQLQGQREERATILASLTTQIAQKDASLSRLLEDEKRLDKLLETLREATRDLAASGTGIGKQKGALPWPTQGKIVGRFGERRQPGNLKRQGVLIAASAGEDVAAVAPGRVVFADWLRGFGLLLIIDHGKGYMSLYGHNQSLLKAVGDWVEPGEVIGSVGDSGGMQESSLYFEIRHNGKPIDPVAWCENLPRIR